MDKDKIIKALECCCESDSFDKPNCKDCPAECMSGYMSIPFIQQVLDLLKEQDAIVHPEPSCELTYITDCCCDLCGVQLIREDNFCRCCGKRIKWKGR